MAAKHLIIMDPIQKLNLALDTSLQIARQLFDKGQEVYICEPRHLHWSIGDKPQAFCQALRFNGAGVEGVQLRESISLKLQAFSNILMRKDPPYDLNYITTTWILDAVKDEVRVINNPEALRKYNEKLALYFFPHACQAGITSCNYDEIYDFMLTKCGGDAVIKPLHLYGGRGIERLQLDNINKTAALNKLKELTNDGADWRLIQPFNKAIFSGEVRVFSAFGKPLAWCLKIPAKDNYLANTGAGAQLQTYQASEHEVKIVTEISQALSKEGVEFIGFDLIGGYVSEINITSPRLLRAPSDKMNYIETIIRELCS
ncbi:MAG: hypothetical protein KBD78_12025 [Oligoflexales bacterium]|nr:hypothetical protein [Oligoflexales bacterium]